MDINDDDFKLTQEQLDSLKESFTEKELDDLDNDPEYMKDEKLVLTNLENDLPHRSELDTSHVNMNEVYDSMKSRGVKPDFVKDLEAKAGYISYLKEINSK